MTIQLPSNWWRADSQVEYCFTDGIYRIYIFTQFKGREIRGVGIRKDSTWILSRTFFIDYIDTTHESIQRLLSNLFKQITLYEL